MSETKLSAEDRAEDRGLAIAMMLINEQRRIRMQSTGFDDYAAGLSAAVDEVATEIAMRGFRIARAQLGPTPTPRPGVEARVRALVDRWEREAAERAPDDVIYTHGVVALLRAALSGPADEHPADGTGA